MWWKEPRALPSCPRPDRSSSSPRQETKKPARPLFASWPWCGSRRSLVVFSAPHSTLNHLLFYSSTLAEETLCPTRVIPLESFPTPARLQRNRGSNTWPTSSRLPPGCVPPCAAFLISNWIRLTVMAAGRRARWPITPRQPHELLHAFQAGPHRRRAHHQALHGKSLGRVARGQARAHRSVAGLARFPAPTMDADAARIHRRGLEAYLPPSRPGPDVARKNSRTLRLARTPSRSGRHEFAREDGMVATQLRAASNELV